MAGRAKPKPKPKACSTDRTTSRAQEQSRAWTTVFLDEFAKGANVSAAARVAGVGRRTVYNARETDPAFAEGWEDALAEAQDRIRAEVTRRAIEGWEEPIIGSLGDYRDGHLLGVDGKPMYLLKFDNGLLARLAVAHCPEFKEKAPAGAAVNINITISPERLQQLQERTRARLTGQVHDPN